MNNGRTKNFFKCAYLGAVILLSFCTCHCSIAKNLATIEHFSTYRADNQNIELDEKVNAETQDENDHDGQDEIQDSDSSSLNKSNTYLAYGEYRKDMSPPEEEAEETTDNTSTPFPPASVPEKKFTPKPCQKSTKGATLPPACGTENAFPSEPDLNLNTEQFGFQGPLTLGTQYSSRSGLSLSAQITNYLLNSNDSAFNVGLTLGFKEDRLSATFGHSFNENNFIKITGELLAQRLNFNFDSGDVQQWIGQSAVGFSYQYLLPEGWISNINTGGYYAKAASKDLGIKQYFTSAKILMDNYRNIAGATSAGANLGTEFFLTKKTKLNLAVNYDDINYHTKYQPNVHEKGVGETAELEQILGSRFKISFMESLRKIYHSFTTEINWLLDTTPGTMLEFGIRGGLINHLPGQPSDKRIGLVIKYKWDGNPLIKNDGYEDFDRKSAADILAWTSKPAVYMEEVLAMADQKSVLSSTQPYLPPTIDPIPESAKHASYNEPYLFAIKPIVHNADTIDFENKEGLPEYLKYNSASFEVSGTVPDGASLIAGQFRIKACNTAGCTESDSFEITMGAGRPVIGDLPDIVIVEKNPLKIPLRLASSLNEGRTIVAVNSKKGDEKLPAWLTFKPEDDPSDPYTLMGTPPGPTTQPINVTVYASNRAGETSKSFKITVVAGIRPTIDKIDDKYKHASYGIPYRFEIKPFVHNYDSLDLINKENLPQPFTYDQASAVISGTAGEGTPLINPQYQIKACNTYGCIYSESFTITVGKGLPVIEDLPDQNVTVGQPLEVPFYIADVENEGTTKVYADQGADPLPDWLKLTSGIDSQHYILKGTPSAPTTIPLNIIIHASNLAGGVSKAFKITVNPKPTHEVSLVCPAADALKFSDSSGEPSGDSTDSMNVAHHFSWLSGYIDSTHRSYLKFVGSIINNNTFTCSYWDPVRGENDAIIKLQTGPLPSSGKYTDGSIKGNDCGTPWEYLQHSPILPNICQIKFTSEEGH